MLLTTPTAEGPGQFLLAAAAVAAAGRTASALMQPSHPSAAHPDAEPLENLLAMSLVAGLYVGLLGKREL